ncbi:LADA_0H09780g1_1 [Lachancea dasiensis]|uniref:LADA_0H09780g1_1 n=1 Tax=Lachancea dasiensis TaxID=1072105 RepID=A0A1G4K2V6_9SACH|nr:LADA_0H09780g1_1 [Lachancea dasiensis]
MSFNATSFSIIRIIIEGYVKPIVYCICVLIFNSCVTIFYIQDSLLMGTRELGSAKANTTKQLMTVSMMKLNIQSAIDLLKKEPSAEVISSCLSVLDNYRPLNLEAAAVLAKHVVPVAPSLPQNVKTQLFVLLEHSFTFLTHAISLIQLLRGQPEAKVCRDFLLEALNNSPSALQNYNSQCNTTSEFQLLKSVFFGSKLYNCLSCDIDILEYLELLEAQMSYIFDHQGSICEKRGADCLASILSLHGSQAMSTVFKGLVLSNRGRFDTFLRFVKNGSIVNRNKLLNSLVRYLDSELLLEQTDSVYNLLRLMDVSLIQPDCLVNVENTKLQVVLVGLMDEKQLLHIFDHALFSFQAPGSVDDGSICCLLSSVLANLSAETRHNLSSDNRFLDSVTVRLASQDALVRERTMFLAKQITNDELIYESDFKIDIPIVKKPQTFDVNFNDFCDPRGTPRKIPQPTKLASTSYNFSQLSLSGTDDRDDGVSIVFLKDLLHEFEQLSKTRVNRVYLLKTTVKLVRQKRDFIMEVEAYSAQLLAIISSLTNEFDEPEFQEWRLNAMNSILVTVPSRITDLYQILFGQELSLQQRIAILSTVGLAARELRGLNDAVIIKPETNFPTERLPWDQSNQSPVIESVDNLTEARTVWRSRKLDRNDKDSIPVPNRFRKIAPKFFYPLAHGWLNGIDMGMYDKMFKKHYLSTMEIILSAAHPHQEFNSMCAMMYTVLEDAMKKGVQIDDMMAARLSKLSEAS